MRFAVKIPDITFDTSFLSPPLSIRAKLFALIVFLVLILVFSSFYLQSVFNESARLSVRQSDIIQALTDTSDANLQYGRFRWTYLTFLNQPNGKTAEPALRQLDNLKAQLKSLDKLSLDEEAQELYESIDSLHDIIDSLQRDRGNQKKTEEATQRAITALGKIDDALGSMSESLKEMLNQQSAVSLKKTLSMRVIPVVFILGGLLSVAIALVVITLDIFVPINKITGAMTAASADTENARKYILPVDRKDEVGTITRTLNHLLEEVSSGIDQMRQTENMLNHAQRIEMMGRMSGGIAHDFNNMLVVISGNLELIERRVGDNPELKKMIESALASVDKGRDLTQRILVFSRKQILKPEILNINQKMPDTVELILRVVQEDIVVESDLAEDLWDINADPAQLENAILNLAINARDAIAGKGGKIMIRTKNINIDMEDIFSKAAIDPGAYVMVSVRDNGSGIPEDVIDRVFDPFFTTKEPGKGTGLGLSMVYGFTRQSGGYVTIDSQPDKGTTISLFFPRAGNSEKKDESSRVTQKELFSEQLIGGNESLFVVEDREDVLRYLSTTLRELGYKVTTARNGPAALRRMRGRKKIDLLITDVVMPGQMNGEELAVETLKLFPETRVLYISGYTRDALVDRGALKPGVNLLTKPFTTADLAREIRQILDS